MASARPLTHCRQSGMLKRIGAPSASSSRANQRSSRAEFPWRSPGAKCPCQGFKTRRKVANSKIVHDRYRLPDSWADLHMKATDLIGRSIFDTASRGFRRSQSDRRNSRVILTDRHESRADLGGNRCRNSNENLSGIRFALIAFRDLQVVTRRKAALRSNKKSKARVASKLVRNHPLATVVLPSGKRLPRQRASGTPRTTPRSPFLLTRPGFEVCPSEVQALN